jgi:N-acetylmuramoyl-L-alanine amidase
MKIKHNILIILFIFLSYSHLSAKNNYIRAKKIYGKNYVRLGDVANYYGMKLTFTSKTAYLTSQYSRILFTFAKRAGIINGVKVNYLSAPVIDKGIPYIGQKDFLILIDPILRYKALRSQSIRTIVIDPGHGGKDNGAAGTKFKEKDIVLSFALKLRWLLRKNGYNAIVTRSTDHFIPLDKRPELSTKYKADLFISIHCNSASEKVHGIETYFLTPEGEASTRDIKPSYTKFSGNFWNRNNSRFAYEVHKSLIHKLKAEDRGIRHARFAVLKTLHCPGILIETGYLSNSSDQNLLGNDSYQNRLVNAIYEGIVRYQKNLQLAR